MKDAAVFGFSYFAHVELETDLVVWSNPNQSNRRSAVQKYFSLISNWIFSGCTKLDHFQASSWHFVLLPLVNISAQLLWPRCAVPTFQVFEMSKFYFVMNCRLSLAWCNGIKSSRINRVGKHKLTCQTSATFSDSFKVSLIGFQWRFIQMEKSEEKTLLLNP